MTDQERAAEMQRWRDEEAATLAHLGLKARPWWKVSHNGSRYIVFDKAASDPARGWPAIAVASFDTYDAAMADCQRRDAETKALLGPSPTARGIRAWLAEREAVDHA